MRTLNEIMSICFVSSRNGFFILKYQKYLFPYYLNFNLKAFNQTKFRFIFFYFDFVREEEEKKIHLTADPKLMQVGNERGNAIYN